MAIKEKDMKIAPNEFLPEKDVTKKTEDGREIVIARAGMPMPLKTAKRHGLVKGDKTEKPNKKAAPGENKSATSESEKAASESEKGGAK